MGKKTDITDEEITANIATARITVRIIGLIIMEAKYMEDEPNDNTPYLHALSIQSMGVMNLMFLLFDEETTEGLEAVVARAMFLRSLVEAAANIHYFAIHKNDDELANKFLKTADVAEEALQSIRSKKKFKRFYWTDKSISKRISDMESIRKGLSYSDLYFYLSSFVHADAGFLNTLPRAKSQYYPHLFFGMAVICMMDIMDALEDAGALRGSSDKFTGTLQAYLDPEPEH